MDIKEVIDALKKIFLKIKLFCIFLSKKTTQFTKNAYPVIVKALEKTIAYAKDVPMHLKRTKNSLKSFLSSGVDKKDKIIGFVREKSEYIERNVSASSSAKRLINIFVIIPIILSILITSNIITNKEAVDEKYSVQISTEILNNIYVYDCNNTPLYTGGFSDDEKLQLATFHLLGDRQMSVPTSILYRKLEEEFKDSGLTGFAVNEVTVNLTIDLELQKAAYEMLASNGHNGCIIVADYKTGEIKAMVSTPTKGAYESNDGKPDGTCLDKAFSTFPPGSVFKGVTVAAALENNVNAKSFTNTCSGKYRNVKCIYGTAHGKVGLSKALWKSCNCSISKLANEYLTKDLLISYAGECGVLDNDIINGFTIGNAEDGRVADFPAKDLLWAANGQDATMVTPMNIVAFYNGVANNGVRKQMYFEQEYATEGSGDRIMTEYTSNFIKDSLVNVLDGSGLKCKAFGKTGTAELDKGESHAWFVCCVNDKNAPTYTVLAFVEHGGSSKVAKDLTIDYINNNLLG